MNRDFVEMLSELCAADVKFMIVGAQALAAHGVPRAVLSKVDFVINKKASGRPKDLLDLELLAEIDAG